MNRENVAAAIRTPGQLDHVERVERFFSERRARAKPTRTPRMNPAVTARPMKRPDKSDHELAQLTVKLLPTRTGAPPNAGT